MRKLNFVVVAVILTMMAGNCRAQSLSDLFSKDNISKVISSVTGSSNEVNLIGTWTYKNSAVEFESDNLLLKAGGAAAATVAENKVDEQLSKVGIKEGQMSFTFNADSTFVSTVGSKKMNGTYSYDKSAKQMTLKFLKLLNVHAKVNYSSSSMDLLFNSDKLLKLMAFLGSKSSQTSVQTISSLAEKYDGMLLGFELKK